MSVLQTSVLLTAAAALLTGSELVALRREFRPGGLADPAVAAPLPQYRLVRCLNGSWVPALATAEVVLGACLPVLVWSGLPVAVPVALLALVISAQAQLMPSGRDGADDMSMVVTMSLAIALAAANHPFVVEMVLAFMTAQLCLSYFTAGLTKLAGPLWRAGEALPGIMRTASYGRPGMGRLLGASPLASRILSWCIIFGEIAFPGAIIVGGPFAVAALALGLCFHLAVAFVMGLNRFVPWYLATYPAALWISHHYGLLR